MHRMAAMSLEVLEFALDRRIGGPLVPHELSIVSEADCSKYGIMELSVSPAGYQQGSHHRYTARTGHRVSLPRHLHARPCRPEFRRPDHRILKLLSKAP